MLLIIAFLILALWIAGIVTSYTIGGLIHLLLGLAVVLVVLQVFRGRKAV
jgi:hypothetical protein